MHNYTSEYEVQYGAELCNESAPSVSNSSTPTQIKQTFTSLSLRVHLITYSIKCQ